MHDTNPFHFDWYKEDRERGPKARDAKKRVERSCMGGEEDNIHLHHNFQSLPNCV